VPSPEASTDDGSDTRRIAAWIAATAPPGTVAVAAPIQPRACRFPEEEALLAHAVPRRCDEFRTGRALARRALAGLGRAPCAIPPDADRVPQWPPGTLGSISHAAGLCIVEIGSADRFCGIGLDLEATDAVDPDLATTIARPDEWRSLQRRLPPAAAATLCFSAKEAVYKALFPSTRRLLDFRDVRLEVDPANGRFEASSEDHGVLRGRFARMGGHVVCAVRIAR